MNNNIAPTNNTNSDFIFISYSHKDTEDMKQIVKLLTDNGYNVWYDSARLDIAVNFRSEIASNISKCTSFFMLVSDDYIDSDFCMKERIYAEEHKKEVVPIYIKNIKKAAVSNYEAFILSFGHLQYIKFSSDSEAMFIRSISKSETVEKCHNQITKAANGHFADKRPESFVPKPNFMGDKIYIYLNKDDIKDPKEYTGGRDITDSDCIMRPWFTEPNREYYVIIQNGVEKIPDLFFCYCNNLKSVEMSNDTAIIGEGAFLGCKKLESVSGAKVTKISAYAFCQCEQLETAKFDSIRIIDTAAFAYCPNLNPKTTFGMGTITELGENVFLNSFVPKNSDRYIFRFNSLEKAGEGALAKTDIIAEAVLSDKFKTISSNMFYECGSLVKITARGVTEIEDGAFCNCTQLREVDIPNITSVGDSVFSGCKGIKNVVLPDIFRTVGSNMFYECSSLAKVTARGVTEIKDGAFYNCTRLQEIDMPNVTSVGENAFCGCKSFQSNNVRDRNAKAEINAMAKNNVLRQVNRFAKFIFS